MKLFGYFVYIVKCKDESYYTGITNDVERRVYEHNTSNDESTYTFDKRPVTLVFYEPFKDVNQAIAFEKQGKGWTRKKKEALIENNWNKIKELAICKNSTSYLEFKTKSEQPFDYAQGDK
jgi:putative endonuclease